MFNYRLKYVHQFCLGLYSLKLYGSVQFQAPANIINSSSIIKIYMLTWWKK